MTHKKLPYQSIYIKLQESQSVKSVPMCPSSHTCLCLSPKGGCSSQHTDGFLFPVKVGERIRTSGVGQTVTSGGGTNRENNREDERDNYGGTNKTRRADKHRRLIGGDEHIGQMGA